MDVRESQSDTYPKVFYNWEDITTEFSEAVNDLSLGELLHDELFGLFEAMAAIVLMDPKMDAGMHCNRGIKKCLSFGQAVKTGILKLNNLTNNEIIAIIDTTLACIVAWLEGYSLAQTVFTNLYLHKPYSIEDKILKAFCLAIYKLIDIIKYFIHKAMVFEEEDFQPLQYGYQLNPDISEPKLIEILNEIEDDLKRNEKSVGLYSRIKFIRVFYQCLLHFSKNEESTVLPTCERLLVECREMLNIIQNTSADQTESIGFEPLINQRLLFPGFPRYIKIKPNNEAFDYFNELINRLTTVCKINSFVSFHSALDFFIEFSRNNSCILSRSILQLLYINGELVLGNIPFIDVLKQAASSFMSPQAKNVDSFFARCVRLFTSFIQICGHNRARQREKLAQLLEKFITLQDEAYISRYGTWILYHTLKIMVMYLLAGFELELYSVYEYYYVFWYLYEFLYDWLVSASTRAEIFKKERYNRSFYNHQREIIYYQALKSMSGGFYKALLGFKMDGKINTPHPQFDSEQIRFEHRFAAFSGLSIQYEKFREMTTQKLDESSQFYTAGCKHFHQARCLLESITPDAEVEDLLKVAKTNFVVLKLLAGGYKKDSTVVPDFEFVLHRYFPVIKLN